MQDYILDPRNNLKINRIKLALTHLEASDIAGEEIEVDTLSGYVEPFFGLGDFHSWGDLGWLQDWYIRPVFKKKAKSLFLSKTYSSYQLPSIFHLVPFLYLSIMLGFVGFRGICELCRRS